MNARLREIAARAAFVAALAIAVAGNAAAQAAPARRGPGAASATDSAVPFDRAVARIVQRQLNLSDDQLARLQQVDRRFRQQQRANQRAELAARREVRRALAGSTGADSARLGSLVDRMIDLQGERVALLRAEQAELRQFLTPTQRARYLGIQEFLRRRSEELRDRGGADAGGMRRGVRRPPRR